LRVSEIVAFPRELQASEGIERGAATNGYAIKQGGARLRLSVVAAPGWHVKVRHSRGLKG